MATVDQHTSGQAAAGSGGGEPPRGPGRNPFGHGDDHEGGFRGKQGGRRGQKPKIKWTTENDRKLLLYGFDGYKISAKDFGKIAAMFPEGPTAKSIQERITKLHGQQDRVLGEAGLNANTGTIAEMPEETTPEAIADFFRANEFDVGILERAVALLGGSSGEKRGQESGREGISPPAKRSKGSSSRLEISSSWRRRESRRITQELLAYDTRAVENMREQIHEEEASKKKDEEDAEILRRIKEDAKEFEGEGSEAGEENSGEE